MKTTDVGATWRFQTNPTGTNPGDVVFYDESTGWISGDEGRILKTATGG